MLLIMPDSFWITLPVTISSVVTGFIAVYAAIKANKASVSSDLNTVKIEEVHKTVNSRMSELLDAAKKASKAEGVKEGEDKGPEEKVAIKERKHPKRKK